MIKLAFQSKQDPGEIKDCGCHLHEIEIKISQSTMCSFVGKIYFSIKYIIDHYFNKPFRFFKQWAVS